jgi:hypothetical protein
MIAACGGVDPGAIVNLVIAGHGSGVVLRAIIVN